MTTTPDEFNTAQIANGSLSAPRVTELVRYWQNGHGLTVDGKAGSLETIPSIDAEIARRNAASAAASSAVAAVTSPPADPVAAAGLRAVAEAQRLFALDIIDPSVADHSARAERSRRLIEDMIRVTGWKEHIPYKGNGAIAWCIIFLAKCWAEAGIDPKWLFSYWESTDRIDTWFHYKRWNAQAVANPKPATGPLRLIAELDSKSTTLPFPPQPGDIVLVGADDSKRPWGTHGELVVSYDAPTRTFSTIGGNAKGAGPDGTNREGVIRAQRKLGGPYCVRRIGRLSVSDLRTK